MRVVYAGSVPPIKGGVAQHGGRLVEALRAEGHEVELVSWLAQYPRLLFRGEQVDVRAEPNPLGANFALSWWNPASWWSTGRRGARADLFVFPWITPFQAVHLRTMIAALGDTPAVAFVHNPLPHEPQPFDRALTRWVLSRVRGAVMHSASIATKLAEITGPGTIANLADVGFPSQLDLEPTPLPEASRLRLLFLGFVRPYKGLETAVEAVRLLVKRGREVELTVAGEFWEPIETWRDRVRKAGLGERVHLVPGYASDEDMAQLLAEHHVLVAPYHSATQSGVVPLALAAGRPIVATNVGGLPERVLEGENGALAPPRDPAAFADAIERVHARLDELAAGAAADQTSWANVARAVVDVSR